MAVSRYNELAKVAGAVAAGATAGAVAVWDA